MQRSEHAEQIERTLQSLAVLGESIRFALDLLSSERKSERTNIIWMLDCDAIHAYVRPDAYATSMCVFPSDGWELGRQILERSFEEGAFSAAEKVFIAPPHRLELSSLLAATAERAALDMGRADLRGEEQLRRIGADRRFRKVVDTSRSLEAGRTPAPKEMAEVVQFLQENGRDLMLLAAWPTSTSHGRLARLLDVWRAGEGIPGGPDVEGRVQQYVSSRSNDLNAEGRPLWRVLMDEIAELRPRRPLAAAYSDAFALLYCAGIRTYIDEHMTVAYIGISRAVREAWHRHRKSVAVSGAVKFVHPKVFGVAKTLLNDSGGGALEALCADLEGLFDLERGFRRESTESVLHRLSAKAIRDIHGLVVVVREKWEKLQTLAGVRASSERARILGVGERSDALVGEIVRAAQLGSIRSLLVERSEGVIRSLATSQRLLETQAGFALVGANEAVGEMDIRIEAEGARAWLGWMPCWIALQTSELSSIVEEIHAHGRGSLGKFATALAQAFASDAEAERDVCLAYVYGAAGWWDLAVGYARRGRKRATKVDIRTEARFFHGVCLRMLATRDEEGGLPTLIRSVRELKEAVSIRRDPRYLKELATAIALAHQHSGGAWDADLEAMGIPNVDVAEELFVEAFKQTPNRILKVYLANNLCMYHLEHSSDALALAGEWLETMVLLASEEFGRDEREWPPKVQDTVGWGRWRCAKSEEEAMAARELGIPLLKQALKDRHLGVWERASVQEHLVELEHSGVSK